MARTKSYTLDHLSKEVNNAFVLCQKTVQWICDMVGMGEKLSPQFAW
jgi:hypothetical protein